MPNADFELIPTRLSELAKIHLEYGSFANDFGLYLESTFSDNPNAFNEFFHSPQYITFIEILNRRFATSVDANQPDPFLRTIPASVRSQLNKDKVEEGLYRIHWGQGPNALLKALGLSTNPESVLSLYFDLSAFDATSIVEVVAALSDLYRSLGGDSLYVTHTQELESPVSEGVPT